MQNGVNRDNTKAVFNVGFFISNPTDNLITCEWRRWKQTYAEIEWHWYLSEDRSVEGIKQHAKIWDKMHSGNNIVNSNYGWLWNRNNQLNKCISELKHNRNSRKAYLTLFDGKEKDDYSYDTPCTLNIGFYIHDNSLCMNVIMRSNDLIYGFCNDQYAFSKLQQYVANELNLKVGNYFHYASDFHIYSKHFNMYKP